MLDLDFIEIGTSDFNTLIEKADDSTYGISIEPLKFYLDNLPNKKNVIKINCAISDTTEAKEGYIFYLLPRDIELLGLQGVKGCNRINDFHPAHKMHNLEHIVQKDKIKMIPLADILVEYNVRMIDFLKIDTEGFDIFILDSLLIYLKSKERIYWPKKIQFESNHLSDTIKIKQVLKKYQKIGYKVIKERKLDRKFQRRLTHDTILELRQI
jgi:hypothetical protein